MLGESERKILEILSKQLLITKEELIMRLSRENFSAVEPNIQKLRQMGYVDRVESLGICYVLTQAGHRAAKN